SSPAVTANRKTNGKGPASDDRTIAGDSQSSAVCSIHDSVGRWSQVRYRPPGFCCLASAGPDDHCFQARKQRRFGDTGFTAGGGNRGTPFAATAAAQGSVICKRG